MSGYQSLVAVHTGTTTSADTSREYDPASVVMPFSVPELDDIEHQITQMNDIERLAQKEIVENKTLIAKWLKFALTFNYVGQDQVAHFLKTSYRKQLKIVNGSLNLFEKQFAKTSFQYNDDDYTRTINAKNFSFTIEMNDEFPVISIRAESLWVSNVDLDSHDTTLALLTFTVCRKMLNQTESGSVGLDIGEFSYGEEYLDELKELKELTKLKTSSEDLYNYLTDSEQGDFYHLEIHSPADLDYHLEKLSILDTPNWYQEENPRVSSSLNALINWVEYYNSTHLCLNESQHKMLWFCNKALALCKKRSRQNINQAFTTNDAYEYYYPSCFYSQVAFGFAVDEYFYDEISDYANNTLEGGMIFLDLDNHKHCHEIISQMAQGFALINFLEENFPKRSVS